MLTNNQLQDIYNKAISTKSRNWKAQEDGSYRGEYYNIIGEKENPTDVYDKYIVTSIMETDPEGCDYEAGIFDESVANYIASVSPDIIMQMIDELKIYRSQK